MLDLVRLLLEHGADVNGWRRDGVTALHGAAYRGLSGVVRYLLANGANPSLRAYDSAGPHAGQTGFDIAIAQGHREVAELPIF